MPKQSRCLPALTERQIDYWNRDHFTKPSVEKGLVVDKIRKEGLSIEEFFFKSTCCKIKAALRAALIIMG